MTREPAQAALNLTEAAKLAGVSSGRLYLAIEAGRPEVMAGGGPGKPTMVTREALQTFRQSEGLQMPEASTAGEGSERLERLERSIIQTPATERLIERLADQVVDRLADRLTKDLRVMLAPMLEDLIRQGMAGRQAPMERAGTSHKTAHKPFRLAILARLRTWKCEGVSTRQMAERLQTEMVPTLSGRGA